MHHSGVKDSNLSFTLIPDRREGIADIGEANQAKVEKVVKNLIKKELQLEPFYFLFI